MDKTMILMESAKTGTSQVLDEKATAEGGMTPLPLDFAPGKFDVICGRGKAARDHEGNVAFRARVRNSIQEYANATSKLDKTIIVSQVVQSIRTVSPEGGFVKEENGRWYEVGDHMAREKVGQSLRDLLHSKYRSSTKSKRIRRKETTVKMSDDVDELIMTNSNIAKRIKQVSIDVNKGASDEHISNLFDATNAAILDELKKDDRFHAAGVLGTSEEDETEDSPRHSRSDSQTDAELSNAKKRKTQP